MWMVYVMSENYVNSFILMQMVLCKGIDGNATICESDVFVYILYMHHSIVLKCF